MTFSGLSAGGAKAPRSPLCLCKGIHRLYDGAEDGQNGKLCNPFTGLNLIGSSNWLISYAHLAGIIAVNHATPLASAIPCLMPSRCGQIRSQPSLLAIQWQCRWEPPHGPALEAAGERRCRRRDPASAARCGTLGENSVFAHFFYFQGCHSKGASFLSIRFLASV